MKTLCIIKTGTTYPEIREQHGDFDDWFVQALSRPELALTVHDVTRGDALPESADGVLVTGSPAMVSDRAAWSERTALWLKHCVDADIPVLGVCYGHQLLAHALGGRADYHPAGREIGSLPVSLTEAGRQDRLLGELPGRFVAHLTHKQSAITLPPGAEWLAYSEHEPHQAFRFGDLAWGVQFHPEFSAPVMTAYFDRLDAVLASEGLAVADLRQTVQDTPEARSVLDRFARLVAGA